MNILKKVKFNLNFIKNMKINAKLISIFSLITIFTMLVGGVGYFCIQYLKTQNEQLSTQEINSLADMNSLAVAFERQKGLIQAMVLAPKDVDGYYNAMTSRNTEFEKAAKAFKKSKMTSNVQSDFDKIEPQQKKLVRLTDDIYALVKSGKIEQAATIVTNDVQTLSVAMEDDILNILRTRVREANQKTVDISDLANSSMMWIIIIFLLGVGVCVGAGILFSKMIASPIKKLSESADNIAKGNTNIDIIANSNDEIGNLIYSFNLMATNIKHQTQTIEKIAEGNLDVFIEPKSEYDVLSNSINKVAQTLKQLLVEMDYLLEESKNQNFNAVGDADKFFGGYRRIVVGVNDTLSAVREKVFWYEAMLDCMPFLISVTDMDLNWTFVNKPVEKFVQAERKDLLNKHCSNMKTCVCGTEDCNILKLKNGISQSKINNGNKTFQVDTSYLYNTKGEKIGHIEFAQDITAKETASMYEKIEVEKLAENLHLLAQGKLNLNIDVSEGNAFTVQERENFTVINNNLSTATEAISVYIKDISHVLTEMSKGNLQLSVNNDYLGDFIEIKDSLKNIISSFNDVLFDINTSADEVSSGARQVSEGSQALAQGATQQSSSIEELTATITEIASAIRQNAISAKDAKDLSEKVKENAHEGNEHMLEMLKSMNEINSAASNISKIIKVIDAIAFQTNILALNASVEAARAGQHGKGFAVVAGEVRNLAVRCAEAAKETTGLIEGSIERIKEGTSRAKLTSDTLSTIIDGIEHETELVGEIARASSQQANAIVQINIGIEQVSKVVQTNSATAEESAAASEELSGQAGLLKDMVGKFKIIEKS